MPNKNSEQTRKELYETYEDSLFQLVMHDAAEKEGRLFLEEKEKLKSDPEFMLSREAVEKFSKLLDARLKNTRAYAGKQRLGQVFNRAAIALLIMLVILGATVVSVEAVRVRVLNFFMDIQQEYTSFQLKDSSDVVDGNTIIDWRQAYVPTYIPEGYEVNTTSQNDNYKKIEFKNAQGSIINYMELSSAHQPTVDTENADLFETITINGHEGALVVKNSLVTVIWAMNDRIFIIQGKIDRDMAVKMAEGVKYIE